MIKSVTNSNQLSRLVLKGYKSIAECDLSLGSINVLIGANGAGKSNFIGFFKLIGRILDEQLHWAVTTPEAANTPFNTVNGDLFRWYWLWEQIAGYFGLEVATYPGHPTPLEGQMVDAPAIWAQIVAKHGLQDIPVTTLASWWHSDADLGRTLECFTDMTNSRTLGFKTYQQTPSSFFDVFDALRAQKIIPA